MMTFSFVDVSDSILINSPLHQSKFGRRQLLPATNKSLRIQNEVNQCKATYTISDILLLH